MQELDIRDIAIIDSFPVVGLNNRVLTVGCGEGRLEYHLQHNYTYNILATDIENNILFEENPWLHFEILDITKIHNKDFIKKYTRPVVICAQVLEHFKDWKLALRNLIDLATIRVIITVPYKGSFHSPDHINFWDDETIKEYVKLAAPYSTAISKIRTKPEDMPKKGCFLIVIDKKQKYGI